MNNTFLKCALAQYKQGNLKEALEYYQKVLVDDPNHIEALHGAGITLSQLGHQEQALQYLDEVVRLASTEASFHNSRGNVLSRLNRFHEAAFAYDHATHLEPQSASTYANLGNCFLKQGKWRNAEKAYLKAIALDPTFAPAHYNYARLLIEREDYNQAITELKKAIEIVPNYTTAMSQLAHVYLYQENYPESIAWYEKCLNLHPEDAESHYACGLAHIKNNDLEAAIGHLNTALALNPKHPRAHSVIGNVYIHMGNYEAALSHNLQQLEREPLLESYYNIGVVHMYRERHQEAIDYFKQAIELQPDYIEAHLNIAAIYLKLNQLKLAEYHYQATLAINQNDPEVQHILTALQQTETPKSAPINYAKRLFNEYATHYDQHLNLHLQYRAPKQLYEAVTAELNQQNPQWRILDLGCGTGLCGEYFKPLAKELIGIDISEKMLMVAKNKMIYDHLENESLQEALERYHDLDLILAADVFTYLGDLADVFQKVKKALKPHGLFAFTVEKTFVSPYQLQQTIRYAHSKKYLTSLIKENDFTILRFDTLILRTQKKKPLEGYLVMLESVHNNVLI